jgi:hypothetical protein
MNHSIDSLVHLEHAVFSLPSIGCALCWCNDILSACGCVMVLKLAGLPAVVLSLQDVAGECGVRAMPTFQAYFNGEKVAEFSGADPKGLENMIKRSAQLSWPHTSCMLSLVNGSGCCPCIVHLTSQLDVRARCSLHALLLMLVLPVTSLLEASGNTCCQHSVSQAGDSRCPCHNHHFRPLSLVLTTLPYYTGTAAAVSFGSLADKAGQGGAGTGQKLGGDSAAPAPTGADDMRARMAAAAEARLKAMGA